MSIDNSKELLSEIRRKPANFYFIHYSCQSLYDDNEALSPRITSIAITHFSSEQTVSFSTHSVAEELHIIRECVQERFDEVERKLLEEFYKFIRDRRDRYWIHWNMRNLTFGFEHLEHRYRVLGEKDAPVIPVEHRINLNDMLSERYGSNYIAHPKMKSLMDLNGGIHRHFLTGEEEVRAFHNNEFIRMHNSTLVKTSFFLHVVRLLITGKLKTASRGWGVALDRMFESRMTKTCALIGTIVGIFVSIYQIMLWLHGSK